MSVENFDNTSGIGYVYEQKEASSNYFSIHIFQ